jgi:cation-transporting ATPase E
VAVEPVVEQTTAVAAPGNDRGLSGTEVAERTARGLANVTADDGRRTVGDIVRANVLTRFNAILGPLLLVVLATGEHRDALFGIVLVVNALVGIVQELRAKATLDRLAVVSAPRVRVVRDGRVTEVATEAVVVGDVLDVQTGDQVPVDGTVVSATALEVDESLLTGESDALAKLRRTPCCRAASWWQAGRGSWPPPSATPPTPPASLARPSSSPRCTPSCGRAPTPSSGSARGHCCRWACCSSSRSSAAPNR